MEREGAAGFRAAGPRWADRIVLDGWYEDAVVAARAGVEERFLFCDRARSQRRVLGRRRDPLKPRARRHTRPEVRGRRPVHAREHHVPDAVRRAADVAVPDHVLLLAVKVDGAGHLAIGDVAAADEARPAVVLQYEVAVAGCFPARGAVVDYDAPDRSSLRHRPELSGVVAARAFPRRRGISRRGARDRHVDRQVRQRTPEVVKPEARSSHALVEHEDKSVDHGGLGHGPEARHLGVKADLEHERVGRRPVSPRLEEDRVPLGAELVGDLLARNGVEVSLDGGLWHRGVENADVGPEDGDVGAGAERRSRGRRRVRDGRTGGSRDGCQAGGDERRRQQDGRVAKPARPTGSVSPGERPRHTGFWHLAPSLWRSLQLLRSLQLTAGAAPPWRRKERPPPAPTWGDVRSRPQAGKGFTLRYFLTDALKKGTELLFAATLPLFVVDRAPTGPLPRALFSLLGCDRLVLGPPAWRDLGPVARYAPARIEHATKGSVKLGSDQKRLERLRKHKWRGRRRV